MSSKVEFIERTEAACLSSQEARECFKKLGIVFKPASFEDVYRIASRDTGSRPYSYISAFSGYGKEKRTWIFCLGGIEIGFYFSGLWKDQRTEAITGELGMVHVAPKLRQRGLGTLIDVLGRMELVEEEAKIIRSVVGDETGTILKLNGQLGFVDTGEKVGPLSHPVQQLLITDREKLLQTLENLFSQKIKKIKAPDLDFNPKEVDIDNPERVSIVQIVSQGVSGENYSCRDTRVLFGYHYAPIFLSQEYFGDYSCLHLVINGKITKFQATFSDFSLEVSKLPTRPEFFEVWSPELKDEEEIKRFVLTFAKIGESFFRQYRKGQKTNRSGYCNLLIICYYGLSKLIISLYDNL